MSGTGRRLRGLALVLVGCCLAGEASAQEEGARSSDVLYVEALGNALYVGSINYERRVGPGLWARVGASPLGTFPLMVSYLAGRRRHHLEAGLGVLVAAADRGAWGTATLGYRYQPSRRGLLFRAGLTPLLGRRDAAAWLGVSVGWVL